MLVVVAIVGIVTAMAAPSFESYRTRLATRGLADQLTAALRLARSEAIGRGMNVAVCASGTPATSCNGGAGQDWSNGWVVVADPAGAPQPLRTWPSPGTGYVVNQRDSRSSIVFTPNGMPVGNGAALTPLSFRVSRTGFSASNMQRIVCLSVSGRPRTAEGAGTCDAE